MGIWMMYAKRRENVADVPSHKVLVKARREGWNIPERGQVQSNAEDMSIPDDIIAALKQVEVYTNRAAMHRYAGSRMPRNGRFGY